MISAIPIYDYKGVLTGTAKPISRQQCGSDWPARTHRVFLDNGKAVVGPESWLHGRVPGWRSLPTSAGKH